MINSIIFKFKCASTVCTLSFCFIKHSFTLALVYEPFLGNDVFTRRNFLRLMSESLKNDEFSAIQNEIKPNGGGTSPNELFQYFLEHDIPVRIDIFSTSSMQEYIEFNTIAVIILDMNLIRYCENVDFKTDRFYGTNNTSSPHFIVVKGYIEVDEELFFEVYDGASGARYFQDGSYKGKNRYYRGNDLVKAVGACKWGMKAMVISKK